MCHVINLLGLDNELPLLSSLVFDQLVDSVFQVPRALATPDEVQQRLVLGVEILDARALALPPVACVPNAPQVHP
jgi:hypothetical protein